MGIGYGREGGRREETHSFMKSTMIFGRVRVIRLTIVFTAVVAEEVRRWLDVEDVDLHNSSKIKTREY